MQPVVSVIYWHVELDAHNILLAEGAFFREGSDHAVDNPTTSCPASPAAAVP